MARDLRVKVRLQADTKEAERNVASATSKFSAFFATLGGFTVIAGAFGLAARKVLATISEWVAAANVQEDAINALNAQLAKFGPNARLISQALLEQATALQSVTRFGDEATISAQAQLAVFAKSGEGIKALTIAAQDFATAQGIDIVSSAKLLGKTLGSSTNALTRYGIEVDGAAGSSERLESLTSNIANLFGGRAQEAAKTYAGVMERVANAQSDFAETIGGSITGSESLSKAQQTLAINLELTNKQIDAGSGIIAATNELYVNMKSNLLTLAATLGIFGSGQKEVAVDAEKVSAALKAQATSIETAEQKMKRLADESIRLVEAQDLAADAVSKLGAALGETTSIELSNEIFEITKNLELSKEQLGANSDEFVRLEEIAREKIDSLKARIESLRDGLGDLRNTTSDTNDGLNALGTGLGFAADEAGRFRQESDTLRSSLDRTTDSAGRLSTATGVNGRQLVQGRNNVFKPEFSELDLGFNLSSGAFSTQSRSRLR